MLDGRHKGYKGKGMEGWVARWYTRTRQKDMADFRQQATSVSTKLKDGSDVLEVAPGPGFFAIELAKLGKYKITGLDVSWTFVEIATANARKAGVSVDFHQGNASLMPFAPDSFDFVYCSAAFKNFTEPVGALNEMWRVLRPVGEAVIVDLRRDVSLDEIDLYVKQSGRSGFDAWMTKWAFRCMLIKRAYTEGEFVELAEQSKFGKCEISAAPLAFEVRFRK